MRRRSHRGGHVIQCVAYAKAASKVFLRGNARDWWANARGIYARGSTPEAGSILSFRAIRRMPLGHVAVVRSVVDDRTIIIDQSHWAQNGIAKNVRVIDVSPRNDWSAVRVAVNRRNSTFGSIYPTHGFIYPYSDDNVALAQNVSTAHTRPARGDGHRRVVPPSQVAQATDNIFEGERPNRSFR